MGFSFGPDIYDFNRIGIKNNSILQVPTITYRNGDFFVPFFQIKYEGTKEKLMEMVNIFNFNFSFKIIKYPAG